MILRKLRLKRGWSQDQLAEFSGLSVRTIQRIEHGRNPSIETAKSLAAVFEVDYSTFIPEESVMTEKETIALDEIEALKYAKRIKDFYEGIITYVALTLVFILVFSIKKPEVFSNPVFYLVLGGAGIGVLVQGLIAFEVIRWPLHGLEKRIAEKKLGRKL